MPIDDKMSVNERRKYLKLVAPRYAKAGRVVVQGKCQGLLFSENVSSPSSDWFQSRWSRWLG
jgi:hypothetical protein